MAVNSVDRKSQAAPAPKVEETKKTAAPAAAAPKAEAAKPAAAAPAQAKDSYNKAQPAAAKPAATPEKAVALKEQRRTSRAGAGDSQLIGAPASAPKAEVLSTKSAAAKQAVKASIDFINSQQGIAKGEKVDSKTLTPRSIERDELGMTHVRMDRQFEGVKVFGEQVISHIGADGKVAGLTGDISKIPAGLGSQKPAISKEQAVQQALKEFGGSTDRKPTAEQVIVKGQDGQYHKVWHVEATNIGKLSGDERPRRMNYLIDDKTGKSLGSWNQMGGVELNEGKLVPTSKATGKPAAAADPVTVTGSAAPGSKILDNKSVSSTINIADDLDLKNAKLTLDVNHTYTGDLKVSLTSPSGKTFVVQDRKGGSADDIKKSFDLSSVLAGEGTKGAWKLTIEDKAALDTGTFNKWSLDLTGPKKGGIDPPPPPPPAGTADDTTMYSGKVQIDAKKNADGTYTLEDGTRGKGVNTYDNKGAQRAGAKNQITDANNVWGEATDSKNAQAGVDAQYAGQMTYDYMKNVLGRDSLDGKGEALNSYVHTGKNYVNAFWDGTQMNYGDGDGSTATALTSLDIGGHEIGHGLTERTSGLIYSGESGGLNEAMSDINGKGVEWYAAQKNPKVKFSWGVGESVWTPGTPGDALRYMNDPTKDGYSVDNYKNYPKQTEVHGSSGIANNAFYLSVEGGTNKTSGKSVASGIGMEKALKIFNRANIYYLTPNATFKDARAAGIKAATDLYGASSAEVKAITDAWTAVGVS